MNHTELRAWIEILTGGNQSAAARLVGVHLRSMQRWLVGDLQIHPVVDLIAAFYGLVAKRIGAAEALELLQRARQALSAKDEG